MISFDKLTRVFVYSQEQQGCGGSIRSGERLHVSRRWEQSPLITGKPAVPYVEFDDGLSEQHSPWGDGVGGSAGGSGGGEKERGGGGDMTVHLNNWQRITDLRESLREIFGGECFTCDFPDDGFWHATLFGLEPEFMMSPSAVQEKMVDELKRELGSSLDPIFSEKRYATLGYHRVQMLSMLQSKHAYNDSLGHLACDFLGINMVVINADDTYYRLSPAKQDKPTLFLCRNGNVWGSVVSAAASEEVYSGGGGNGGDSPMTHLLDNESTESRLDRMKPASEIEKARFTKTLDETTLKKMRKEVRGMKIRDLQDRATDFQIPIRDKEEKKKLKSVLQEELFLMLTGKPL